MGWLQGSGQKGGLGGHLVLLYAGIMPSILLLSWASQKQQLGFWCFSMWLFPICSNCAELFLLSSSVVSNSLQPHGQQHTMSFTISQTLPKLMSIESMMLSKYFILCLPLTLLPSIFPASQSFPMSQFFPSSG